jgi:hypothetical protein
MTSQLKALGPYRIERSDEYIPGSSDNSYAEMIRVRGPKPKPPYFLVPSHIYKYSESEIGLYLNGRKNLWRALGKQLKVKIDISDREIMVNFPISLFPDVAKIVPFVKKRGSQKLPPKAIAKRDALNAKRHTDKMKQNNKIAILKDVNRPITLDTYMGNKIPGGNEKC